MNLLNAQTLHEIIVGIIVGLVFAIPALWRRASNKLALVDKRQMRRYLDRTKDLGTLRYTEEMQSKMRRCLCLAVYLVCCVITVFALPWPDMRPLEVTLAGAAAILACMAGAYNEISTPDRLKKRRKEFRERLGLGPEEEEQIPQPGSIAGAKPTHPR